jgi:alcohol dehydrogenase
VADAAIQEPTDVVVKVDTTTICGTDLHYAVPENVTNEQAIFLADSLPTGYEIGVLTGGVRPGDTFAVVGAGAVGLSAVLTTGLWGASKVIAIDTNKFRLEKALEFGATDAVEVGPGTVADVTALTDGLGVDVAIEAVRYPETLLKMVASGRIPAEKMGTHSFTFDQLDEAYDVFKNAAANMALKVIITPGG